MAQVDVVRKNDIELSFTNCRNIDRVEGESLLVKNSFLNVFFGRNGTGKSTISKVLDYLSQPNDESLFNELRSFKYLASNDQDSAPRITCSAKKPLSILTFNGQWVSDHCFRNDGNLHGGAYRLCVSSNEVRRLEKERNRLIAAYNETLNAADITEIIEDAESAAKDIGVTKRGPYWKAFKESGPLEDLPEQLIPFANGLAISDRPGWMQWHIQGYPYAVKIGERCPYCGEKSQSLVDIAAFDQRHDESQGKSWLRAVTTFTKESLFRVKTRKHALRLIGGAERNDDDIRNWFLERAQMAKSLATCLAGLRESVSTYGDNSSDRFFETLSEALEQLEEYGGSFSDYTDEVRASLRRLCTAIKRLQAKESEIRGVVGRLESKIASSSSEHKDEIDEMLRDCGYPYTIEITGDYARQEAKVLLVPRGTGNRIETPPNRSLSYGEQNAIALIMFMFDVITTSKAKVIVLDDPISSFDGDKRFTLLYRLFHNFEGEKKNLFGRTVLLLTHDYLVVSDIANVLSNHFKKVNVKYLETRANVLYLRSVSKDDIVPYSQMIIKRIESSGTKGEFFQLVYIRCLCEMNRKAKADKKSSEGCAFQVISEIAHMRTRSDVFERYGWDGSGNPPYIIRTGENFIRRWIPDFDMLEMLDKVCDEKYLIELYKTRGITAYEKLQIIRVLIEGGRIKPPSAVITRYANETFHLAGDYLLQLDPVEFNPVPENITAFYEEVFNYYERMAGSNSTVIGNAL